MEPRSGQLCSVRDCYSKAVAACEYPTVMRFQPAICARAMCDKHAKQTRASSSSEPRVWCAEHHTTVLTKGEPPPPPGSQGSLF